MLTTTAQSSFNVTESQFKSIPQDCTGLIAEFIGNQYIYPNPHLEEMKIFSTMRTYIDSQASSASIGGKIAWIHQIDMVCRDPSMHYDSFGEKANEGFATFDQHLSSGEDEGYPNCWLYPIRFPHQPLDYDPFDPLFEEHLDNIQAEFNLV